MVLLRAPGIDNQQAPSWFEHAGNFSQPLTLEVVRQVVHHQGTERDIERLVGEWELLDHPGLEVDLQAASSRFAAGTGEQLRRGINARHKTCCANALFSDQRQRSSAAAYIQHRLSGLELGQVCGRLPQRLFAATQDEPHPEARYKVIDPAPPVEDVPSRLEGRGLARLPVVMR